MLFANFSQQLRQNIGRDHCRGAANTQAPAFRAGKRRHLIDGPIMISKNLSRPLGYVYALGSGGKRAQLCDGDKGSELSNFHGGEVTLGVTNGCQTDINEGYCNDKIF